MYTDEDINRMWDDHEARLWKLQEAVEALEKRLEGPPTEEPTAKMLLIEGALKDWRVREARLSKVPAYVILRDESIRAIAAIQPSTPEELAQIKYMGEKRVEEYGPAILQIVKAWK